MGTSDDERKSQHRLPKNLEIHQVITMNEAISHADNLRPWDSSIVGTILRGDSACCLTNDFQQADQSQVEKAVCIKVRLRLVLNKGVCLACMIQHMT